MRFRSFFTKQTCSSLCKYYFYDFFFFSSQIDQYLGGFLGKIIGNNFLAKLEVKEEKGDKIESIRVLGGIREGAFW